ncbi:MAG: helix-turn-helix domain-containing protein [Sphaerochaetaceae bacterium]
MENNIGNDSVRQEVSQSSTERVNTIQIERRFELEKDIMTAITSGNRLRMQELLEIKRQICPDNQCCENRAASDVLRGCKNNLVSFNTVCRIAARQGGLQPLYLYNIYNKYALIIEKATSVQYLNEDLYAQMSLEYIDSVMAFSVSSYSPVIQKIVTYLTCHLDEDVTVVDLSKIHRMHVSHISRKFKQETGMSIPEYVNQQRIGLGKLYFETGNCSITEVSGMLGYHDSNYFGKIFKKVTGDTPSQYLRKINSRQDVR